jgi:hypothetical protein
MKTVYNSINIFNNTFIINGERKKDVDVEDIASHAIIFNDNIEKINPLVAELEERILQSENEKQELIEEINRKKQDENGN